MQSGSSNKGRFIASCLRLAAGDLKDTENLHRTGSRNDTYHLEQAVEKILKAIMTSEGLHIPRPEAHQLEIGVERLPDDHPLKADLMSIGFLTEYATTYRYSTDNGRIKHSLPADRFDKTLQMANSLLARAADHFQVDSLDLNSQEQAKHVTAMRSPSTPAPKPVSTGHGDGGGGDASGGPRL